MDTGYRAHAPGDYPEDVYYSCDELELAEEFYGSVHRRLRQVFPDIGALMPMHEHHALLELHEDHMRDCCPGLIPWDNSTLPMHVDRVRFPRLGASCEMCGTLDEGDGSDETADRLGLLALKHSLTTGHHAFLISRWRLT